MPNNVNTADFNQEAFEAAIDQIATPIDNYKPLTKGLINDLYSKCRTQARKFVLQMRGVQRYVHEIFVLQNHRYRKRASFMRRLRAFCK